MRLQLTLRGFERGRVILPSDYNYLVQAAIYQSISRELADFLHERGFLFGKRRFRMFTFSRLQGSFKFDSLNRRFIYEGDVVLQISSPIDVFIRELATTIVERGFMVIGGNRLKVVKMAFPRQPEIGDGDIRIKMLSPVTVYSTLITADGRKKTYYYSPFEKEFSKLINLNAKKKHFLLTNKNISTNLKIKPLRVKEVITSYKGFTIKGWTGSFILRGPKSLIRTVYETGLGAKNSQGFGMFEVIS